jgi:hypothetical protein
MAGEGPPSTTLALAVAKVVDADVRRHDEQASVTDQAIGPSVSTQLHRLLLVGSVLALVACGYSPPTPADTARPSYHADLAACETSGDKEAHRLVMSHGGEFLTYPISIFFEEHRQVRKCMQGKGYVASR